MKFDEKKFERLAQEMPALSEVEQRSVLGGDLVFIDTLG